MRVAVTGSAGTGKSTLVARLGRRLSLPVVPEGMREYLERTGVDLHSLGPDGLQALVLGLWEQRQVAERQSGFVADRCSVDFAAFWLFYRFHDAPESDRHLATWAEHARGYDRVILLPHGDIELAADGIRSSNHLVQLHVQLLIEGFLARFVPGGRVLRMPPGLDVRARADWAVDALSRT